ncbi:MAG: hypothetical protein ACI4ES_12595 [Roseburia sp.]
MNAQIYNIILEDSANIAGFFRDQPGGELCLALLLDICHALAEKGQVNALECVIEAVYAICEIPKQWDGAKGWSDFFVDMLAIQISSIL